MFIHLNCHSNYSFLAGSGTIERLVQSAATLGCSALALTDTNGLYGAVPFYRAAQTAGIRPIFGVEIDARAENPSVPIELVHESRAVLLAKNLNGFGEICRIINARQLDKGFCLANTLSACSHDIIVLAANADLLQRIAFRRGRHNLFAELVLHEKIYRVHHLVEQANSLGLPYVATNRVFFPGVDDWQAHRLLSAIRTGATVHTLPSGSTVSKDAWLKSSAEMVRLFRDIPSAFANTEGIAGQCRVELPIGTIQLPPFAGAAESAARVEGLGTPRSPSQLLCKLAYAGLHRLYSEGGGFSSSLATARKRLRYELKIIDDLSFASYFLIVWDIVREAHARGIPTVGRGSAANSLVCACLGITEVDPIEYNLYFERFLNPERTDYPDIDIDFPWNRRDEIIDYVFEKYGRDKVALISSHIHLRGRSTLREVGKALGVPIPEIDAFVKKLPFHADVSSLEEMRQTVPECQDLPLEDEPYRTIINLGKKIEGFPRHLSIHCGGIVVSPQAITDLIPLQKTVKGFVVTQYDMYPVEDMGLLKIDLLAQKGLAVLADGLRNVEQHYGVRIDFGRTDPVADPKTKKLVREGRSIGCFYIESPGMRNLLQKLNVETFEMLTAASSIIRPGVADSGMMKSFIERHRGRERVTHLHPKMEAILKDTYGVMIYQEDVIKVAHAIAGMSLGEADSLRKCMSKKRDWERMETYRERFLSGARSNGVRAEVAQEIWRQIESFAGYAFCKAHSASFAVVSYQTAYLKAHYPAEFMAAVLSNRGGFYDTAEYLEEARRMGLRILLPDVNHSAYEFTAVNRNASTTQGRQRSTIRVGLMQVRNLSRESCDAILNGRTGRNYHSLDDFIQRAGIDASETESLIRCGALDGFGATRPEMLWQLALSQKQTPGLSSQGTMFQHEGTRHKIPCLPQYGFKEKLWAELECLDLTVTAHLLSLYNINLKGRVSARDLPRFAGRCVTLVGWLVSYKRTRTVHNQFMKFMMLEDPSGPFEVTLFPKVYQRFGRLLYGRGPFIVKGKVERDGHCHTLTAFWLDRLVAPGAGRQGGAGHRQFRL